jgi:DNA-binding MarR family transcriptional regulator
MISSYDQGVGRLTSTTSKKIVRYLNFKLEKYNITIEQWVIILTLSKEDNIKQKQLAEKTDKDQPTVARILDILERKKFIKRHQSLDDRRAFCVHLTENGKEIKAQVEDFMEKAFETILFDISEENIEVYKQVLLKINKNIDEN